MTREEFIKYLENNNIPFEDASKTIKGYDAVYVVSKREYEKKRNYPRKYKDLYVPYLRVSHFDEERWYTRENGWVEYKTQEEIMKIVKELGAE